jgi:hypothetical protein
MVEIFELFESLPLGLSATLMAGASAILVLPAVCLLKGRARRFVAVIVPVTLAFIAYRLPSWFGEPHLREHYDPFGVVPPILWSIGGLLASFLVVALRDAVPRKWK